MKERADWVVFKDRNGHKWSGANIQDLIDGYISYKKFLDVFEHYKGRF